MARPITKMDSDAFRLRFWSKVAVRGHDDCWEWAAKSKTRGYGVIHVEQRRYYATHVAMLLSGNPRPDGLMILHSCDNKLCVNPIHLRWGTCAENIQEAAQRGLMHNGAKTGGAKLSIDAVKEIKSSNETQKFLASKFGVDPSTISYVKSGRSWKYA